jgi:hypothetical protein
MRYLLLIYGDESRGGAMGEGDAATSAQAWFDYTDWLAAQGWMKAGDALHPSTQATTVTVVDGERIVTDGPFAETKEQLGGYHEIDVPNLDDAIEAAARCPGAATGTMEIRPVADFGSDREG